MLVIGTMQETRQQILDVLRERGSASVVDLVEALRAERGDTITPVTVRHHLNALLRESLVATTQTHHPKTPGRPQHIYTLSQQAHNHFPNNYQELAVSIMSELATSLPPPAINVIFEGVAVRMAHEVSIPDHASIEDRLTAAVAYLNQHGYSAWWEHHEDGYVLTTKNCPYYHVHELKPALCHMDSHLVAHLVGVAPKILSRIAEQEPVCAYLIPKVQAGT